MSFIVLAGTCFCTLAPQYIKYLGLWLVKSKPPPRANGPPVGHHIDYGETQFPSCDDYNVEPEYPIDTYAL